MERFRILEHPADIGFEAFGSTREEVFANAARALFHLIIDLDSVEPRTEVAVRVEQLDDRSLAARVRGEKFDRTRHRAKLQVKAITYHQLELKKMAEGWQARVFVDI